MISVAIDFAPGLHGHFLEYVINRYIFEVPSSNDTIFQESGSCHPINTDEVYKQNKVVQRGHYSSFAYAYSQATDKVIFIEHNPMLDFVLLTNIFYRCHPDSMSTKDFNVKEIEQLQKSMLANLGSDDLTLRSNWYAKLTESQFEYTTVQPKTSKPVFKFDYTSFFDLTDFCNELKRTSKFLDVTFKFDVSLGVLWSEFIARNQGWALYQQGNNLLELALQGADAEIPNDWKLHSYLNFRLSKAFELYDGPLFTNKAYPATTTELLCMISEHVENFDKRW